MLSRYLPNHHVVDLFHHVNLSQDSYRNLGQVSRDLAQAKGLVLSRLQTISTYSAPLSRLTSRAFCLGKFLD